MANYLYISIFTHAYYACYYVTWHRYADCAPRISAEFHRANEIHSKNFEKYENAEKSKTADVHLARVLKISRLYANFNWDNIFSVNDAAYPQWRTHQLSFYYFISLPLSRKKSSNLSLIHKRQLEWINEISGSGYAGFLPKITSNTNRLVLRLKKGDLGTVVALCGGSVWVSPY